ncbi:MULTISPECIES: DNA-processing protein DprA [Bacillus]|uniref:DNA-processing protein DprA n=1 Tax=Bacillus TaxID=1386 RepID=UPI000CCC24D3|nr:MULTISPECIES: DNA-processing protein DprA [Bacillus]GCF66682.1 DNA protecting protein DprA [Bacillus cereus]MCC2399274.1 DNA-processing protein DprA [Bacillus paranthracis]MCU5122607.1 DNA-processing protein DprA [Bacillus paranthracis]MCU5368331.1 DNA-processing protein DprA [Bacillus paranthracis]MCU5606973.1 DNA-processing protein DprA [Bacillus paranthracis]
MNQLYDENQLVTLLLCSHLALDKEQNKTTKVLSLKEWNDLVLKLQDSKWKEPSALFNKTPSELVTNLNINANVAGRIELLLRRSVSLALELEKLHGTGIYMIFRKDYPPYFRKALGTKAPPFFYIAGNIENIYRSGIAVVGSRNVDEQGILATQKLAQQAVQEGLSIISGGARGVDITAQEAALDSGGYVVSILHSALASTMKKKNVREAILAGKLTLLSAVPPNSRFYASNAMNRNKYVYTLSRATFVISCDSGTGGTWAGAVENLKNSWVPLFVRVSGDAPSGNINFVKEFKGHPLLQEFHLDNSISLQQQIKQVLKQFNSGNISYDAYNLVFPIIKELILSNDKITIKKLADFLNLEEQQAKIWYERAIQDMHLPFSNDIHQNSLPKTINTFTQSSLFE